MSKTFADAQKLFATLPDEIGLKFLRKSGRTAAESIKTEAAADAPVDKGLLRKSIMIATKKESDTEIQIDIGPERKIFWGIFREYGTAHEPKRPWLLPAADKKAPQAADQFGVELSKAVDKHFNK